MILEACNWMALALWGLIGSALAADAIRGRSVARDAALLIMVAVIFCGLLNGVTS